MVGTKKGSYGEDNALVLDCLAFGHGTSVATGQPLVAFCCPDCWQFDRLSWRALILAARQQLSLQKLSFGGFDFVWAGFVACQCPLSLAGPTQTRSFDRGKRTHTFGDHCVLASAEFKRCEIQVSSSICFGGQCIPQCRGAGVD